MIEFFRTNQFLTTLFLFPYTLLIRINTLLNPKVYELREFDTPITKYFFTEIITRPLSQNLFACLLIFLMANFVNRLIIRNRLTRHFSLIPGLVFILLTSLHPGTLMLTPAIISAIFLMGSLLYLNRVYKNKDAFVHLFNIGFYIGISALFYPGVLIFWMFSIIGFLNLRSFKINEILILLSGVVVPYFLAGTYYFWNDQLHLIFNYFQLDKGVFAFFTRFSLESLIVNLFIAISVLFAVLSYNQFTMKTSIQVQKKIDIIYWFMLFTFLSLFFIEGVHYTHLIFIAIPFSIFLGLRYEAMKNRMVSELVHVGLVIAILFIQFQVYY